MAGTNGSARVDREAVIQLDADDGTDGIGGIGVSDNGSGSADAASSGSGRKRRRRTDSAPEKEQTATPQTPVTRRVSGKRAAADQAANGIMLGASTLAVLLTGEPAAIMTGIEQKSIADPLTSILERHMTLVNAAGKYGDWIALTIAAGAYGRRVAKVAGVDPLPIILSSLGVGRLAVVPDAHEGHNPIPSDGAVTKERLDDLRGQYEAYENADAPPSVDLASILAASMGMGSNNDEGANR